MKGVIHPSWRHAEQKIRDLYEKRVKFMLDNPRASGQALWSLDLAEGEEKDFDRVGDAARQQVFLIRAIVGALSG